MTLALLDGDEAIFKACCAKGKDLDFETGGWTERPATFAEARDKLDTMLLAWRDLAESDRYSVILSPDDRKLFRRGVFADYKAGRSDKPEHFWHLVEHIRAAHPHADKPGLEADDLMGVMSGKGTVIVSSDKDMKTVPGRLVNPGKGTTSVITPARADWQWMYQTLMGDSTDGFGGCVGIGPKKAEEILDGATSLKGWWPLVLAEFEKPKSKRYADQPQTRKDAITQATLARILRPGDYHQGLIKYQIGTHTVELDAQRSAR